MQNLDTLQILKSGNDKLISDLPPELIIEIVSHLNYKEIINLCKSSFYLNDLLCQDDYIYGSHPSGGLANSFLS